MISLNEYQTQARKTAIAITPEHMIFGLLEEAGELAGVFKRVYRGDVEYTSTVDETYGFTNYTYERLKAELGDVLWYTAMLADTVGLSLEEVAKYNLSKLQRRKAKDMIHGSGDDR